MVLSPKDSGDFIVKHSKFVSISDDGIQYLVNEVNFCLFILFDNIYRKENTEILVSGRILDT